MGFGVVSLITITNILKHSFDFIFGIEWFKSFASKPSALGLRTLLISQQLFYNTLSILEIVWNDL